jgi:hypothetical protein
MANFGGIATGLGNVATDLSEHEQQGFENKLKQQHNDFQQRQQQLAEQRNITTDKWRDQQFQLAQSKLQGAGADKKLKSAQQATAAMLGRDDWDSIPAEEQDKARTYLGILLTNKQLLGNTLVDDPNSSTGVSTQYGNKVTGQKLSSTPNVVVPGVLAKKPTITPEDALAVAKYAADPAHPMVNLSTFYPNAADRELVAEQARKNGIHLPQQAVYGAQQAKERAEIAEGNREKRDEKKGAEADASLKVLRNTLHGGVDMDGKFIPGLDKSVAVLDNPSSRAKLVALFSVIKGSRGNSLIDRLIPDVISQAMQAIGVSSLNSAERDYVYQMQQAVSNINALRNVTGKMRPTEQMIERFIKELPDPITTNNATSAAYKIRLVDRDIIAALSKGSGEGTTTPGKAKLVPPSNPQLASPSSIIKSADALPE